MFMVVTIVVGTALTLGLYIAILPNFMPGWSVWIIGTVCYGIGGGLGIGAMRWPKMGVTLCGLILGFGLGDVIFYFISLTSLTNPELPRILTISSVMLATVIGFVFMYEHAVVISCSLFGAYAFIRGISMMIKGSYPNEIMLRLITKGGQTKLLPWCIWAYWSLMVVLGLISLFIQLKGMSDNRELYTYGDRTLTWRANRQRKNLQNGQTSAKLGAKA